MKELINRLKLYNEWRRGEYPILPDSKQTGEDIDTVIDLLSTHKIITNEEYESLKSPVWDKVPTLSDYYPDDEENLTG